jgi:hypothetical protein
MASMADSIEKHSFAMVNLAAARPPNTDSAPGSSWEIQVLPFDQVSDLADESMLCAN